MGNYSVKQETVTPEPWAYSLCVAFHTVIDFQPLTYPSFRKVSWIQPSWLSFKKKRKEKTFKIHFGGGKPFRLQSYPGG